MHSPESLSQSSPEHLTKQIRNVKLAHVFGDDRQDGFPREVVREHFTSDRTDQSVDSADINFDQISTHSSEVGSVPALEISTPASRSTAVDAEAADDAQNSDAADDPNFSSISLNASETNTEKKGDVELTQAKSAELTTQSGEFSSEENAGTCASETSPSNEDIAPPTIASSHTATSSTSSSTFLEMHGKQRHAQGPSALQKVISKTRPTFLPPKDRIEDDKHMATWQKMMRQSRAAEAARQTALASRRLQREQQVEETLAIWEKEIVPDWKVVNSNPQLRRLWWRGIPTKLRASMWERAVGNALSLSKDNYKSCHSRAKRAIASGHFPQPSLAIIQSDILATLPSLHIFLPSSGPLHDDLEDMLCAWTVARSDEGLGYVSGVARIAGMLLLQMSIERAFLVMRNLMERHCVRSFYSGDTGNEDLMHRVQVEAYFRIFDTLLADVMPKIYFNFKQHQIPPSVYLPLWIRPFFLDHLPFEACARVWDVILLEGDSFLFRAALGVLGVLEPRLFFPEGRELEELLSGKNKAALEVAKRDGRSLDGGKYEIYGLDEETLWERIDAMEEWWRDSLWTRLLRRELPDL